MKRTIGGRRTGQYTTGAVFTLALASAGAASILGNGSSMVQSNHPAEVIAVQEAERVLAGPDPSTTAAANVPARSQRLTSSAASVTDIGDRAGLDTAAEVPLTALGAYLRAAHTLEEVDPSCALDGALLAAIGRIESDHGRYAGAELDDDGVSHPAIRGATLNGKGGLARILDTDAGRLDGATRWDRAVGPLQVLPSTWVVVGVDADGDGTRSADDMDDAALGAAVYLCAAPGSLDTDEGREEAVLRYNHSRAYARTVLALADAYEADTAFDAPVPPSATLALGPVEVTTSPEPRTPDARREPRQLAPSPTPGGHPAQTPIPTRPPSPGTDPAVPTDPGSPTPGTPTPDPTPGTPTPGTPTPDPTPGTPTPDPTPGTPTPGTPTPDPTPGTPDPTPGTPTPDPTPGPDPGPTPGTPDPDPTPGTPTPDPSPGNPDPTPDPTPTPDPKPVLVDLAGVLRLADGIWSVGGTTVDVGDQDRLATNALADFDADATVESNGEELAGLVGKDVVVVVEGSTVWRINHLDYRVVPAP